MGISGGLGRGLFGLVWGLVWSGLGLLELGFWVGLDLLDEVGLMLG